MNQFETKQNIIQYIAKLYFPIRWTLKRKNSNYTEMADIYNLVLYVLTEFEDPIYYSLDRIKYHDIGYYLTATNKPVNLDYHIKKWIHITLFFYNKYYYDDFLIKREKTLREIHCIKGDLLC